MIIQDNDLVMLRLDTPYGYSNTWWRVLFIDNDQTFVGKLERKHWHEYKDHDIGEHASFPIEKVKRIYEKGEEFCYSDNITICTCKGLCENK